MITADYNRDESQKLTSKFLPHTSPTHQASQTVSFTDTHGQTEAVSGTYTTQSGAAGNKQQETADCYTDNMLAGTDPWWQDCALRCQSMP